VASLSQGRTAAAQCGLFTHKSVPVIFEPPCISNPKNHLPHMYKHIYDVSRLPRAHACHPLCDHCNNSWKIIENKLYFSVCSASGHFLFFGSKSPSLQIVLRHNLPSSLNVRHHAS